MRQPTRHRVPQPALAAATATPVIRLDDLAGQHRAVRLEALAGHGQAKLVQAAEGSQIGAGETGTSGSGRHVEVFRMGSVRTSIPGRPRPLSRDRRAVIYTLNWDELVTLTQIIQS